jgi:hypothetical protein
MAVNIIIKSQRLIRKFTSGTLANAKVIKDKISYKTTLHLCE